MPFFVFVEQVNVLQLLFIMIFHLKNALNRLFVWGIYSIQR